LEKEKTVDIEILLHISTNPSIYAVVNNQLSLYLINALGIVLQKEPCHLQVDL
jgi:hypothetical protein